MSVAPALEMIGVSKRYGAVVALNEASIVVHRGTVHALLGENGAGKTTLMRIAYGLARPDAGEIRINGAPARLPHAAAAISLGVGMVHQHPANVSGMSVAENIELGGRGRFRPEVARSEAMTLARRVGFDIDPRALVSDLTVAAQQRLEILKAISRNARILILDEPTAVLAPTEAHELLTWLREFATGGGTAVVITHRLEDARAYANDLTVLRGGRTVLTSASDRTTTAEVAEAMIGSGTASASVPRALESSTSQPVARAEEATIHDSRGRIAIDRATFDIKGGEIVGVAGVEGSGHHELLLALARRRPVGGGRLQLPDRIGFVAEDRHRHGVVLDFTLAENVVINNAGARRGRMRWRSIAAATTTLLKRFDVRASGPDARMATLSGGNQQKVVLVRELDAAPHMLVAENPTRGLDIRAAAFVRNQIRTARDSGMAIVYYSSDLDELVEASDRILAVHAGRVAWVARNRAVVGAAMLGVG